MRWSVTVHYLVTADDEKEAEWCIEVDDWDKREVLTVAALDQEDPDG